MGEKMRVVIVGAGPAGLATGITVKTLKPNYRVTLIGREKSFIVRCSIPYVIAGKTTLKKCIKPEEMFKKHGLELVKDEAIEVNTKERYVKTKSGKKIKYDYLVFATGATPFLPPIEGVKLRGVYTIRDEKDTRAVTAAIKKAKNVVIVGGGMIGVELASLLADKKKVTIVEMLPHLLYASYDSEISEWVEKHLAKKKVKLILGKKVEKIVGRQKVSGVVVGGKKIKADVVVFATGIRANVELAKEAGIKIGKFGIKTNAYMLTSEKNVYAVGDCAETFSAIDKKTIPSGLVTTAILQAKVAGMNICGMKVKFPGTLNASITELGGLTLGRVGFTEREAKERGIKPYVGTFQNLTKYDTQPDAKPLFTKVVLDEKKRLIGLQVAADGNMVAPLVDFASYLIANKVKADELSMLHYSAHPELTPLPFFHPLLTALQNVKKA